MKKLLILMVSVCCCLLVMTTQAKPQHVTTATQQANISPEQALEKLIQGNQRFLTESTRERQNLKLSKFTSIAGQHPYAVILNCMDSRSIPEILFDTGPGDMFVTRVAGNVASPAVIASIQYATTAAGAKLIVVMGHTQCGAIQAACIGKGSGQIKSLIANISMAVNIAMLKTKNKNCEDPTLINAIAKQNVLKQMKAILNQNSEIADLVKQDKVMLVGAMHNIRTGKVDFFNIDGKALNTKAS